MKHVYFVRHCEYDNPRNILVGRLPVALSSLGERRAEKLHSYFADKQIERIYSSAVLRCKQTAETIAGGIIPVTYDQRLLESLSGYQGYWIAGDLSKNENWKDFFGHRDEVGGESIEDIQKRMISFYGEVVKRPENNIIVCSHDDPLFALYKHITGTPLKGDMETLEEMPDSGSQPKGSVRELVVDARGATFLPLVTFTLA